MKYYKNDKLGMLGAPDSTELWYTILSYIPDYMLVNSNIKILCVACGYGTEADLLVKRMQSLGVSNEEILDRIYLLDKYAEYTNRMKKKGYRNVIRADFLEWKTDMKFDVVTMNPPYLKRTWKKFVDKVLSLDPTIVCTVNPDPLENKSDFGEEWKDVCLTNGLVYRNDATEFFPEVSSGKISAFVMDRSKEPNMSLFASSDPMYDNLLLKVSVKKPNSFVLRGRQDVSGYGSGRSHSMSDTKTSTHVHPSIMSCTNNELVVKYSDTKANNKKHNNVLVGKFLIVNRFFGKNNPDPVYLIDNIEDYNLGYDCLCFKLYDRDTLEGFRSVYGSKLYRLLLVKMRNGGFDITQGNFMRLNKLDLSKVWTDYDIYNHFGLTQEEIDYVEANVK